MQTFELFPLKELSKKTHVKLTQLLRVGKHNRIIVFILREISGKEVNIMMDISNLVTILAVDGRFDLHFLSALIPLDTRTRHLYSHRYRTDQPLPICC